MRLRTRVAAATIVTALAAVILVAGVGTVLSSRFLEDQARHELQRSARAASRMVELVEGVVERLPGRANDRQTPTRGLVLQRVLAELGVQAVPADLDALRPPLDQLLTVDDVRALRDGRSVQGTGQVEDGTVAWAAAPGQPPVVAYRPIDNITEASAAVGRRLLLAGLLGVSAAGLIGLVVGDRLVQPVRGVQRVVRDVAAGHLDRRVEERIRVRSDELGELGRGVDLMTDSLAEARDEQRAFFRNVAHELRTPLTSIRGYAEGLADGAFDGREREVAAVVHDEALRLTRLVDDVMTLARLDVGDLVLEPGPDDLADVVASAASAFGPAAQAADVRIDVDAASTPLVTDPHRVRQVVDNLVANALRIVPAGGRIVLQCAPAPDGGGWFRVADSGPGLTSDDIAVAFQRYELWRRYRGQREVGTGLGLAIVAEVTRRLGGAVEVEGHGSLGGAAFTVRLPGRIGAPGATQ